MTIATETKEFPVCPYPEKIVDEVSGIRVKNDKYELWMDAFVTGLKAGIQVVALAAGQRSFDSETWAHIDMLMNK